MKSSDPEIISATTEIIRKNFEMETDETSGDEAEILAALARRVEDLLETQPEFLMSMLYRLDVEESKINQVLHPGAVEPPNIALAKLIWERQKQRVFTKKTIKTQPLENMDDWAW